MPPWGERKAGREIKAQGQVSPDPEGSRSPERGSLWGCVGGVGSDQPGAQRRKQGLSCAGHSQSQMGPCLLGVLGCPFVTEAHSRAPCDTGAMLCPEATVTSGGVFGARRPKVPLPKSTSLRKQQLPENLCRRA